MKYLLTIEVESDTEFHDWVCEETLVLDNYQILNVEDITARESD